MIRMNWLWFGMAVMGMMLAGGSTARAEDPVAPGRPWELILQDFFGEPGSNYHLVIYGRDEDGNWVVNMGSSRHPTKRGGKTFNRCWYYCDMDGAPIRDGKIDGKIRVYLTPDTWVPVERKFMAVDIALKATLDGTKLEGTYETLIDKELEKQLPDSTKQLARSGRFYGNVGAIPQRIKPNDGTYSFILPLMTIGGDPDFKDRAMVMQLSLVDGKVVKAWIGRMDSAPKTYGRMYDAVPIPVEKCTLEVDPVTTRGRVETTVRTLDWDIATYIIEIDGKRFDGNLIGKLKVTVKVPGKEDLVMNGSYDGRQDRYNPDAPVATKPPPLAADVPGFVPVKPNEHPRLLFRKSDLPALKKKAETPEGKAILARLRHILGDNGEKFPPKVSPAKVGYPNPPYGSLSITEQGYLQLGHAAGYGLLYQLTGEKKYADLGRKCFEVWMTGVRDVDSRYSFIGPNGALRAGSSWAVAALGYDLCHDGWDPAFRRQVVEAFLKVEVEQGGLDLKSVTISPRCMASKNHFGGIISGAAAAAAIMGDDGAESVKIAEEWMPMAHEHLTAMLTGGFGDHGFYAEGHGPSHVSSDTGLLLWVKSAKVTLGKDYITPIPNAQWITLRWVMEMVPQGGRPYVMDRKSKAGPGYGTDIFERVGCWSHSGQFSQGFGAVDPKYYPAMLWVYQNFVEPSELAGKLDENPYQTGFLAKGEKSYDAIKSVYHAVMSFVNWPVGVKPENPATIMPKAMCDATFGYYVFRNRWQDEDDIAVSALLGYGPKDAYLPQAGPIYVWGYGQKFSFGQFTADQTDVFKPEADGSGLVVADGKQLAVDMSAKSGAGLLIASIGIGEGKGRTGDVTLTTQTVKLGSRDVAITMLVKGGPVPEVKVEGKKAIVGSQTITFDGKTLVFGK